MGCAPSNKSAESAPAAPRIEQLSSEENDDKVKSLPRTSPGLKTNSTGTHLRMPRGMTARASYIDVQWEKMRSLSKRAVKNDEDRQVYDWLSDGWWDDSYATSACARFRRMDKDGDGLVDKDEFVEETRKILRAASRDSIATGTVRSYTQDAKDLFHTLDADGNGLLTQEEFEKMHLHITLDIDEFYKIPEIKENLEKIWTWDFDAFALEHDSEVKGSRGIPLTLVAMYVFKEFDLFAKFHLDRVICYNFVREVENAMLSPDQVAYHNRVHIADVVANIAYLLKAPALDGILEDEDYIICILGALVHDLAHPGVTPSFKVNSNAVEARQFNYTSILENFHLHTALGFLEKPDLNIFADYKEGKDLELFRRIRRGIVDVVLTTDMANHHTNIQMLEALAERHAFGEDGVGTDEMLNGLQQTDRTRLRKYIRKATMKCADIANPAKPLDISNQWSDAIRKEWYAQNELEREQKLSVTVFPLKNQEKGQIGFIKFVVQPLYDIYCKFCPRQMEEPMQLLDENLKYWETKVAEKEKILVRQQLRNLSTLHIDDEHTPSAGESTPEPGTPDVTGVRKNENEMPTSPLLASKQSE